MQPSVGDPLGVGDLPSHAERCPTVDTHWHLDAKSGNLVHTASSLCLTIPKKKSAVLQPCKAGTEGQHFAWAATSKDPFQIQLAKGMFRAGYCIGFTNRTDARVSSRAERQHADRIHMDKDPNPACTKALTSLCYADRLWNVPGCHACEAANQAPLAAADCTAD